MCFRLNQFPYGRRRALLSGFPCLEKRSCSILHRNNWKYLFLLHLLTDQLCVSSAEFLFLPWHGFCWEEARKRIFRLQCGSNLWLVTFTISWSLYPAKTGVSPRFSSLETFHRRVARRNGYFRRLWSFWNLTVQPNLFPPNHQCALDMSWL